MQKETLKNIKNSKRYNKTKSRTISGIEIKTEKEKSFLTDSGTRGGL